MNLRILFILLILTSPLMAKTQLLDSTVVSSLDEESIDSVFICRKDYPNFSKWYLYLKQINGFDSLLLNDPFDAMGIINMNLFLVDLEEKKSHLLQIESFTSREHSYGGTGGWSYSRSELVIYNTETKKIIFDGIYSESSANWTITIDTLTNEEKEFTQFECEFSFDYEIEPNGNINFFNFQEIRSACIPGSTISTGTYVLKNGEYLFEEDH